MKKNQNNYGKAVAPGSIFCCQCVHCGKEEKGGKLYHFCGLVGAWRTCDKASMIAPERSKA